MQAIEQAGADVITYLYSGWAGWRRWLRIVLTGPTVTGGAEISLGLLTVVRSSTVAGVAEPQHHSW